MCGCESCTVKKAEHWSIDAFELWCWRRLLRVPWTARRSNLSFLKEMSPGVHWKDWCWSWNSHTVPNWLILNTEMNWLRFLKTIWFLERLKTGWERGQQRMTSRTLWTWVWVNSRSWWWTGRPRVLQSMGSQRVGHDWETELNWIYFDPWIPLTLELPRCL